ncbi:MAG TPA: hypothetical protein VL625_00180 [Patescibacteria group bacterium]|nr:hypothetical protein [Patescibacteria group bacterium]
MRSESVEIFSDTTNAAIMRHPGRRFPGVLIQGDTLYALCSRVDSLCNEIGKTSKGYKEANEIRNELWEYLNQYKNVLIEHKIQLPFSDRP